jgi:hypothetical protein
MLEATITKSVVIQDERSLMTVLMAKAEYYDHIVNIKAPYDWDTMDYDGFIEDLKDKLAKDFDLPVYRVDVREDELLAKMAFWDKQYKEQAGHG